VGVLGDRANPRALDSTAAAGGSPAYFGPWPAGVNGRGLNTAPPQLADSKIFRGRFAPVVLFLVTNLGTLIEAAQASPLNR
jgi:hypothetical protein